jgi:hypothetical protein
VRWTEIALTKFHRRSGKLSYLAYPEFEDDPHLACGDRSA